jgi:hypothetical protein
MLSSEESVCAALVSLQKKRASLVSILARLLVDDEDEEEQDEDTGDTTIATITTSKKGKQSEKPTPKIADGELVHRGLVILRNVVVNFLEKQKGEEVKEFVRALGDADVVQKVEMVVKDVLQKQAQAKSSGGGDPSQLIKAAMEFGVGLQKLANES